MLIGLGGRVVLCATKILDDFSTLSSLGTLVPRCCSNLLAVFVENNTEQELQYSLLRVSLSYGNEQEGLPHLTTQPSARDG